MFIIMANDPRSIAILDALCDSDPEVLPPAFAGAMDCNGITSAGSSVLIDSSR